MIDLPLLFSQFQGQYDFAEAEDRQEALGHWFRLVLIDPLEMHSKLSDLAQGSDAFLSLAKEFRNQSGKLIEALKLFGLLRTRATYHHDKYKEIETKWRNDLYEASLHATFGIDADQMENIGNKYADCAYRHKQNYVVYHTMTSTLGEIVPRLRSFRNRADAMLKKSSASIIKKQIGDVEVARRETYLKILHDEEKGRDIGSWRKKPYLGESAKTLGKDARTLADAPLPDPNELSLPKKK